MRARVRSVVRGPVGVALVILAAGSAMLGVAAARTSRANRPAVNAVTAPHRVSFHTLTTRGLVVRAVVTRETRVLRLALVRRTSPRTTVAKTFRVRGVTHVRLRWRLSEASALSLRAGPYHLEARAGRRSSHLRGAPRRTRLRVFGHHPRPPAPGSSPPGSQGPGTSPPGAGGHPSSATPCGTAGDPPAWQHVVWVVMENKGYTDIVGAPAAPYLNALAGKCGLATQFFADTYPSLPNYIAMTSGSPQGITDNAGPSARALSVPSIFSQLGSDWRSLQESMPGNCAAESSGLYAVKHNPAAYYTNVDCAAQDVPLGDPPDISARFTFITPNMCNDMHDCSVAKGDAWLADWLPKVLDSRQYHAGTTAVFITWDEDDHDEGNHIATLVIAPSTPPGTTSATMFNHYSMLRTTEELLGLPALGGAASAASMRSDFGL
jgi:hypothetical protein